MTDAEQNVMTKAHLQNEDDIDVVGSQQECSEVVAGSPSYFLPATVPRPYYVPTAVFAFLLRLFCDHGDPTVTPLHSKPGRSKDPGPLRLF